MYRAYKEGFEGEQQQKAQQLNRQDGDIHYKLTYFPIRGRAELSRLIFAQVKLPYDDVRIDFSEWNNLKNKTPWGGLPILEVNGQILSQSVSIARFIARETGLDGTSEEEKTECDSIVDTVVEMNDQLGKIGYAHFTGDKEKEESNRQNVQEQTIPKILPDLEKYLSINNYFVGNQLSWADLAVFDMCDKIRDMAGLPHALNDYPTLRAHYNRIASLPNIAEWIKNRPDTDIHNISQPNIYKLTMFKTKGRAELIRLIFAQAGIPYIDNRVDLSISSDSTWETLPWLEINEAHIGHSVLETTRILAKEAKLDGEKDADKSLCEDVIRTVMEVVEELAKLESAVVNGDKLGQEDEIIQLKERISTVYPMLEQTLDSNEFFAGKELTWADLAVFDTSDRLMNDVGMRDLLIRYPHLSAHFKTVQSLPNIQTWIQKRPDDDTLKCLNTKPKYKLTYFPVKYRAEPIRLIFAQAGIEYEDNRILEEWQKLKPETPWGTLPILEVDGQVVSQSMAVARYVAREAGLDGKEGEERMLCDSVVDAANEVCETIAEVAYAIVYQADDPAKEIAAKEKLKENTVPKVFANLEKHIQNNQEYFVGKEVTWADIMVFDMCDKVQTIGDFPSVLNSYPNLASHFKRIGELPRIKAWVDSRPQADVHHFRADKPPRFKLTYFNLRFRAELTRLIFAQAKVEFQDVRLDQEQWADLKSETPWGHLPTLEVDGQVIGESMAIARFVAREMELTGSTEEESLTCDSVCDAAKEVTDALEAIIVAKDDEKQELKNKLSEEIVPKVFGNLQGHLHSRGSQYFAGDDVTWADLCVFDMCENVASIGGLNDMLSGYSKLMAHFYTIRELPNIKAWLSKRPQTEF